jgi:hypothetical protein
VRARFLSIGQLAFGPYLEGTSFAKRLHYSTQAVESFGSRGSHILKPSHVVNKLSDLSDHVAVESAAATVLDGLIPILPS